MIKVGITELRKHFYQYMNKIETKEIDSIVVLKHKKPLFKIEAAQKHKSIVGAGIGILPNKPYVLDSEEYKIEEMFNA